MRHIAVITVLATAMALLLFQPVSAHVLVTDTTKSKGAIIHIIPDDDPIAGQASTLYFDMQDQLAKATDVSVQLVVTDSDGTRATVPMKVSGSLAYAEYTFPAQGVYQLRFAAATGDKTYVFEHSQRVSRGTLKSALDQPSYPWAEMLSIGSGVGIVVTAIVAFNRRRLIAKQSTL